MLGLLVLVACTTTAEKGDDQYAQLSNQQCQQKTADFKRAYNKLKKDRHALETKEADRLLKEKDRKVAQDALHDLLLLEKKDREAIEVANVNLKQVYNTLKQEHQNLLKDYQNCLENKLPSAKQAYREIKQDYQDARQDHNQCQQEANTLTNKLQSCQARLQLYKNNQEDYKKLPDQGFE